MRGYSTLWTVIVDCIVLHYMHVWHLRIRASSLQFRASKINMALARMDKLVKKLMLNPAITCNNSTIKSPVSLTWEIKLNMTTAITFPNIITKIQNIINFPLKLFLVADAIFPFSHFNKNTLSWHIFAL